jgi:hypothetical protein
MDLVARQSIRLAPWRLPAKKRGRQPTGLAKSNSQRQQAYRDRHQRLVPYAAQRDLSFSKLIERRLSALLDEPDAGSSAREVLQRFSSGDIPKSKAMRLLDIEDYGSLILMLNRELLPLPSRPTSLAGPSVAVALKLIGESKQAAAD